MSKPSKNIGQMICLDIYLSSLDEKERQKTASKLKPTDHKLHPLLCGDIYSSYTNQRATEEKRKKDLQALFLFYKKLNWNVDLEEILKNDYFTLVLTDTDQTIQWVNKSFSAMTGYPINYAIGRSPRFLQGEKTSEETKKRIRQQLSFLEPFETTVTNYRKNKDEYRCKVNIYPIQNKQSQVTHFLALERETTD
jgi:PAS domain S-box-containing protein